MKFANPYWSPRTRISMLQRWLIVHSILYYELDNSVVSDKMFDSNAKQLVAMQYDYPEDAQESQYYYVFYDFDGSTGFDLFDRLTDEDKEYLKKIAIFVLSNNNNGRSKRETKR